MEYTVTYVTMVAGFMTVIAASVTIAWFIRDVRKQNSKVLKQQLEVQTHQSDILVKIEEGQRKGFTAMEEGQRKGFTAMEEGQRKGFSALNEGLQKIEEGLVAIAKILDNQTRMLERLGIKPA